MSELTPFQNCMSKFEIRVGTVSLLIVYVCLCLLMIKVSQIKIRKRFPDGQVLERLSGQNINEEKPQKKRENDDEKGPTSDSQKP